MLRRLGILGVLLLGLSGFIPTVWACAVMAQQSDCCPPGAPPCDTDQLPVSAHLSGPACCSAQSAPTRAIASIALQKEGAADSSHDGKWIGVGAIQIHPERTQRMRAPITFNPLSGSDQQQLYLRTGRLRL